MSKRGKESLDVNDNGGRRENLIRLGKKGLAGLLLLSGALSVGATVAANSPEDKGPIQTWWVSAAHPLPGVPTTETRLGVEDALPGPGVLPVLAMRTTLTEVPRDGDPEADSNKVGSAVVAPFFWAHLSETKE